MRALFPAFVLAAALSIPGAPKRWVTDDAHVLSGATVEDVDARLEGYQRTSGHQVIVYVGKTTGSTPIEDWAVRAFEQWGIGTKGKDDGAALFVFMDDRRARIEVGYGLEDRLTDLQSHRILDETVLPELRSGDPDGAIRAGVEAMLAGIDGRAPPLAPATEWVPQLTGTEWALIGLVALALLIFVITHPRLALWILVNIAANARRSRGGGRRGFGGAGGRSGGGGASGSW